MHDSQWIDRHGKRKNYLWLIIIVLAVCVAAALFIRNNSDVLGMSGSRKNERKPPVTVPLQVPTAPMHAPTQPAPVAAVKPPAEAVVKPLPKPAAAGPAAQAARTVESVILDNITCRLMDKSKPSILLSLSLLFPENKALRQEILVKRDNLKVMVKKTLAAKSINDMVVDSLRRDLESGLNSVLENGAITGIEFKEFRIEKVE
jgi:flagellar basal body-associated protein FliL